MTTKTDNTVTATSVGSISSLYKKSYKVLGGDFFSGVGFHIVSWASRSAIILAKLDFISLVASVSGTFSQVVPAPHLLRTQAPPLGGIFSYTNTFFTYRRSAHTPLRSYPASLIEEDISRFTNMNGRNLTNILVIIDVPFTRILVLTLRCIMTST